jgi:hypothetical protein
LPQLFTNKGDEQSYESKQNAMSNARLATACLPVLMCPVLKMLSAVTILVFFPVVPMDSVLGLLRIERLNLPARAASKCPRTRRQGEAARNEYAWGASALRGTVATSVTRLREATRAGRNHASPPPSTSACRSKNTLAVRTRAPRNRGSSYRNENSFL